MNNPDNGHHFGAVYDLSVTCLNCGLRVTVVSSLVGGYPPCPNPKTAMSDIQMANAKPPPDRCECGAHKALGCGKFQAGHSDWCPWSML